MISLVQGLYTILTAGLFGVSLVLALIHAFRSAQVVDVRQSDMHRSYCVAFAFLTWGSLAAALLAGTWYK